MTDAIAATAAPGRSGWWRALAASPVLIALAGGLAAKAPDLYDKIWERQHETGGRSRAFVQQQNIGFDRNRSNSGCLATANGLDGGGQ